MARSSDKTISAIFGFLHARAYLHIRAFCAPLRRGRRWQQHMLLIISNGATAGAAPQKKRRRFSRLQALSG